MDIVGVRYGELHHDAVHVLLDGALGDEEPSPDARVRVSLRHQRKQLALTAGEVSECVTDVSRADELLNERGIDDRATAADPGHSVEEVVQVTDAALQEIAAAAAGCEHCHRLGDFDVCRQDQDRRIRELLADHPGSVETLRPVIWGHPNIHDRQIRLPLAHQFEELRSVTGLSDDLVPAALEQAREAFPHQHVILSDDDSCDAADLGHSKIIPLKAPPGKCRTRSVTPAPVAERRASEPFAPSFEAGSYVRGPMPDSRRDQMARLRRLADEQAALRRIATLVARGVSPADLFSAVSDEVGGMFGSGQAAIGRYEPDRSSVVYVGISQGLSMMPIGTRWPLEGFLASTTVYRTGRPARQEQRDYETATGEVADTLRELNTVSRVGAPIFVEGELWGVLLVTDTHELLPPETEDRLAKFTDLVATAIANAESRAELATSEARAHDLAREQAALRRVATLVAEGTSADEVFSAVTDEVGRLFDAEAAVARFEADGSVMVVVGLTEGIPIVTIGTRWPLEDFLASTEVYRTGRPARSDHTGHRNHSGQVADSLRQMNYVSTVAAPITVEGRLWGVMTVSDQHKPLPPDTEERVANFTDLVATAIAEGESRSHLQQLASEQAALRRVATFVAQNVPASELFSAVAREVGTLFRADFTVVVRHSPDPNYVTTMAFWAAEGEHPPAPSRPRTAPGDPASKVAATGKPTRVDDWTDVPGEIAEFLRDQLKVKSSVECPIVVEEHFWGGLAVHSTDDRFLPDTEARLLNFTELVATAIANAESRAELAASRARVIAAADDARQRIERDLHDGAQQRLVTLTVALRTMEATMPTGSDRQRAEVAQIADGLAAAVDELRELSRGIHPAVLTQGGLAPALKALRRRSPVRVTLEMRLERRLLDQVEAAAYYTVSEALTNASKHASATRVWVAVQMTDLTLHLSIRDDGIGGTDPSRGSGLTGLKDRIESLGGRIRIDSPPGNGTRIYVDIPVMPTLQSRSDSDQQPD